MRDPELPLPSDQDLDLIALLETERIHDRSGKAHCQAIAPFRNSHKDIVYLTARVSFRHIFEQRPYAIAGSFVADDVLPWTVGR